MEDFQIVICPHMLSMQAHRLMVEGRHEAARPLAAAARALGVSSSQMTVIDVGLRLRRNEYERALSDLQTALTLEPEDAALLKCRADLRQRTGDFEGAARDAAEAVVADPRDPDAKLILGQVLIRLGRVSCGLRCLSEATESLPKDPRYREALAVALDNEGNSDAALGVLDDGINSCPDHLALRNAAILLCIRQSNFWSAVRRAEQARLAGQANASTFGMAGHALASLGEYDKAASAFQEALKLCPENSNLRNLAAVADRKSNLVCTPASYVQMIFDGYADRFEEHLLSLRYSIPIQIRDILISHPVLTVGQEVGPALDLGCGTGLVALALEGLRIGPLIGLDLAPQMLARARAKELYAELHKTDIISGLLIDARRWPLIIAADVLCYFGELHPLLYLVHQRLTVGGWFMFSVERLTPEPNAGAEDNKGWSPLRHGRYAHHEHYIYEAACAAGFNILHKRSSVVRQEAGRDVSGLLFVVQRVRHHMPYAGQ